jgi:uncharacterized protein HemY
MNVPSNMSSGDIGHILVVFSILIIMVVAFVINKCWPSIISIYEKSKRWKDEINNLS